jgi:flagellar protein FlgJ
MDTSSLIGSGQNAYSAALQKQAAVNAQALGAAGVNVKKAKAAGQQFEGFFIGEMMEQMTEGVEPDEYFGGGHGEEMWRSMLNQEYAKEISKSGRLGIADTVMKGMLQAQEQRNLPGANGAAATTDAGTGADTGEAATQIQTTVQPPRTAPSPAARRAYKGT